MNWTLLFIISACVIAFLGWLDLLTFMFRGYPKKTTFSRFVHFLAFISTVYILYQYFSIHPLNI